MMLNSILQSTSAQSATAQPAGQAAPVSAARDATPAAGAATASANAPANAAAKAGTTATASASAPSKASSKDAKDTKDTAAPAGASNSATAAANGAAAPAPTPAPAQAFAQWLGQQVDGAAPAATQPAVAAGMDDTTAATTTPAKPAGAAAAAADDDYTKPVTPAQDGALLAAMSMPLMPLTPQQITVALQAAAGNTPARGGDDKTQVAATPVSAATAADGATRAAALALPQLAALQQPVQVQAPAPAPAQSTTPADAAATRLTIQAAVANGNGSGTGSANNNSGADTRDGGSDQNATLAAATPVIGSAPVAAAGAPAADTVKLAGPPTAWRQTLQEALGQRINVQSTANAQQATITLEPPQLGRIDIAIRHSAGTLEVNITATNGEVLRQLQSVGDNLRNDLSQRQYTDVAVTVAPAPKASATPFGDPQQQGRGRQQGRDQESEPGRGLAEASSATSGFSLGGRES